MIKGRVGKVYESPGVVQRRQGHQIRVVVT
jgi:hypothetical protein